MKKIATLSICLLLCITCFTSCGNLITRISDHIFYTDSYILYRNFYENYTVGTDKLDVLKELGYPEAYYDTDGNRFKYDYQDKSNNQAALDDNIVRWYYHCYQYKDPAYPYNLGVYFDSDGKCTNVTFEIVKGG